MSRNTWKTKVRRGNRVRKKIHSDYPGLCLEAEVTPEVNPLIIFNSFLN